jgi:heme-degrading monooxygenase HmoA
MICALTVRKLKPGTFDQFREAFMGGVGGGNMPEGWVRFNMVRSAENPDEVICFGFFDGDVEGVRANAAQAGYKEQQAAIAPFVESVGADGLYEIVEDMTP